MYYHSFIVLKKNNILYGIDFVPSYYSKYTNSKFLRNDNQGVRIFDIKQYLEQYHTEYEHTSRILHIKKELDNTDVLNFIKNLKNKEFGENRFSLFFKVIFNKEVNEHEVANDNNLFCTEFISVLLKSLGYLPKNFKAFYSVPGTIINFTKKPYDLYTIGEEFKMKNNN